LLYGSCLAVFAVGVSTTALLVFLVSANGRGLLTLAGHHRYFSHRSFRTTRAFQLVLALAGATCLQGGPLGWAALHRHHHRHSDDAEDVISPVRRGFWWSQLHRWVGTGHAVAGARIRDFDAFPELLWLERHWAWVALAFAVGTFALGSLLARLAPGLETSGAQLFVWGFLVANAYMIQVASLVNSACHRFGTRPFDTGDESRNNPLVALLAHGEGWHNNHHRFPGSARHGLAWWQLDTTYLLLRGLERLGVVWDLRQPSPAQLAAASPRGRTSSSAPKATSTQPKAKASPTRP
jgi:stearoyl-CoA desaturase (delta-9 desaturase)